MSAKSRYKYKNSVHISDMCRVCLTHSQPVMYDLLSEIDLEDEEFNHISKLQALEKVVCRKVILSKNFPQRICPMCLSIVKMSFKLINQFNITQNSLAEVFNETPTFNLKDGFHFKETEEETNQAPVEIIFGESKFDLKDVLVIEEMKKEDSNYAGFLNNLGGEVSAYFSDNHSKKGKFNCDEDSDAVTIFLNDTNDGIMPIRELKIDEESNTINIVVEKIESPKSFQLDNENKYNNVEYINMDAIDDNPTEILLTQNDENDENSRKIKSTRRSINQLFRCEFCTKIFVSPKLLSAHYKRAHAIVNKRQYICEVCGDKVYTRSAYVNHKHKHIGKTFVCNICHKTYYTRTNLKNHVKTHIDKREHLCSVCGKGFNYQNALVYHMRLHTGEKNYKCQYCPEKFRMPNALKRHERTHTNERPYECKFCKKGFRSKGEMKCHENLHTGYRPYHCRHCEKGFNKSHNLKLHLLSHKGPHRCDICKKSFIEFEILGMHYKIAHKNAFNNSTTEIEENEVDM